MMIGLNPGDDKLYGLTGPEPTVPSKEDLREDVEPLEDEEEPEEEETAEDEGEELEDVEEIEP